MLRKNCHGVLVVSLIVLCFLPLTVYGEEMDGRQIMVLADERPDGDDRHSTIKMTLINKRGRERIREVESYSKDYGKDKKTVMVFKKPADVKGTAFLSWDYDDPAKDDDKWLYMPAMKKVRRISGSSTNEYFMGTDFTYDDMGDRNVDEDTHTLLGVEEMGGRSSWKIESIPVDKKDMYTRKVLWIDQEGYFPLQIEYYDKDGLLKIYHIQDFGKQDGIWTIFKSEMVNVSRDHRTIMETSSMRYDTGIKDGLFKVSTIQRGRIR